MSRGAGGEPVSALHKEGGHGVVLFFGIAGMVGWKAKKLHVAPRRLHERNNRRLAANDLILKLFDGQVVEVRVCVRVVAQIEATSRPLLQNFRARSKPQISNALLDDESRHRNMVVGERTQERVVGCGCPRGIQRQHWANVSRYKRKIVDCESDGASLCAKV